MVSTTPEKDEERLMRGFLRQAYRRPRVDEADVKRFVALVEEQRKAGLSFTEAMIAGYTAVLASPEFVYLNEKPGRLDDYALATRLSLFLWNSLPDAELRARAAKGELHRPGGSARRDRAHAGRPQGRAASSTRFSITGSTCARWRTPRLRPRSTTTTIWTKR